MSLVHGKSLNARKEDSSPDLELLDGTPSVLVQCVCSGPMGQLSKDLSSYSGSMFQQQEEKEESFIPKLIPGDYEDKIL